MWFYLLSRGRQLLVLGWLAGGWGPSNALAADPVAEIKAVSGLGEVDTAKLKRGEILTARGTQGSFARGVYAESCYFLKATPDVVQRTLLHWNPANYKETEVSGYGTYRWPTESPEVFRIFSLDAKNGSDGTLLDWTTAAGTKSEAGELHLRQGDVTDFKQVFAAKDAKTPGGQVAAANAAWQGLLRRHSDAVGTGGFAALPSYKAADGSTIRAADEVRSLTRMTPAIAKRFAPLLGAKPLLDGSGAAADEIAPYAEKSLTRGHTSFCLGVVSALRTPGEADGWLAMDCTYYTTDTYFVSVALYQMWPWEGGTLVWEVDYASAPFRSYLGGVDRVFAGREMTKDSTGAVQTFRKELAKGAH